ncbi:MAG: AAA family ATPase [Alphaproteobacteria bacterium]|nr:AAA family ATPase [Alphaproteobacteria bacterium]
MITSLKLVDFKSFSDATLRMGPFTVIVGTNASGKSNIRDAFRFLHGIGRGYTLAEIIGGKYGAGGQVEWAPMRGTAQEIIRFGESSFSFEVSVRTKRTNLQYSIEIGREEKSRGGFRVLRETLKFRSRTIYTSHPGGGDPVDQQDDEAHLLLRMEKTGDQRRLGARIAVRPDQPALTQIRDHTKRVVKSHKDIADDLVDTLASIRFLDLVPDAMRRPAFPGQAVLGDGGENLPTVLQEICADPKRKEVFTEWVRELTPMDVADFEFPRDPITGLVQLVIKEVGRKSISAYSASDGTLRFLAMLAAILGTSPAKLYFFEEIDNGIHPSRLRLLLDLIEGQTAKGGIQVVSTTHSPDLLSMIGDLTFTNTSVTFRSRHSASSKICPVAELPEAKKLRSAQGLGRLHASGWMEDALAFTEEEADPEGSEE